MTKTKNIISAPIRAALLDVDNVFLRMDELNGVSQLTDRHLPSITECDLPSGKYRWQADHDNAYGGALCFIDPLK